MGHQPVRNTGGLAVQHVPAGKPVWIRSLTQEFGAFRNDYGIASSPVVADGTAFVQIDHLSGSYLLAVHAESGKTKWKVERNATYDNWSTPVVATVNGQKQVIACGTKMMTGYDFATGKVLWKSDGLERLCSPTPIVRGDKLYAVSGPNGANIAFDLAAPDKPKVLWQSKKNGPFVPSAVVVNDLYFVADDQGTAMCLDLKTGAEKWKERIANGRMRPSPVAADGKIYFTSLDGTTSVVRAAAEYELFAKNPLGEPVAASFVLANRTIFVRSESTLFAIGQ